MTKTITPNEMSGVSGVLKIVFAIPTDDPKVWRLRNGRITFEKGFTTEIDVEHGYIPYARGDQGLTVSYYVFRHMGKRGKQVIGDVNMMVCINGRVQDSVDIARGVEVEMSSNPH